MDAIALTRAKTRRRRRKPMPPMLKLYVALVLLGTCLVFYRALKVMLGDQGSMFWLAFDAAVLASNWTYMIRLWRQWWDGD